MKKYIKKRISQITSFGMKKLFSSILIFIILFTNLVVPISVGWGEIVGLKIFKNQVIAAGMYDRNFPNSSVFSNASIYIDENQSNVDLTVIVNTGATGSNLALVRWSRVKAKGSGVSGYLFNEKETFIVKITENGTNKTGLIDVTANILSGYMDKRLSNDMPVSIKNNFYYSSIKPTGENGLTLFRPGVSYSAKLYYLSTDEKGGQIIKGAEDQNPSYYEIASGTIDTATIDQKVTGTVDEKGKEVAVGVDAKIDVAKNNSIYKMLAPIGKITHMNSAGCAEDDDTCIPNDIGKYLNIIFKLAIGICAALAVIMLIINGVKYMGDESVFGKTEAKSQMFGAIMGLLIALGAWALLNTINPALTGVGGVKIDSVNIEIVDLPDAGDGTVDPDFIKKTGSYSKNLAISTEVALAVTKLSDGWQIDKLKVTSSNNKMVITLKKGNNIFTTGLIPISYGKNKYSEVGSGKVQDGKTPKGTWKILEIRTSADGKPVFSGTGSNMGATFWLLNPTTNGERGIGIHGNKNGTISNRTAGCVLLSNSDLLALLPYIKIGIPVIIE